MRLLDVGELKLIGGAEMAAEDGLHARFISGFRYSGIMATAGSALSPMRRGGASKTGANRVVAKTGSWRRLSHSVFERIGLK
jgi:hypothetical protein